jgi:c-di-GMP-binding flagellar brake protein YcgR
MTKPMPPRAPAGGPAPARITQRAHPRTKVAVSAEIDTFSDRFTATTRDLSLGGVGLDVDRPLTEGAAISLSLFLVVDDIEDETAQAMTVRARVAWCAEADDGAYNVGVRFENLLEQQRHWLARFLASAKAEHAENEEGPG